MRYVVIINFVGRDGVFHGSQFEGFFNSKEAAMAHSEKCVREFKGAFDEGDVIGVVYDTNSGHPVSEIFGCFVD